MPPRFVALPYADTILEQTAGLLEVFNITGDFYRRMNSFLRHLEDNGGSAVVAARVDLSDFLICHANFICVTRSQPEFLARIQHCCWNLDWLVNFTLTTNPFKPYQGERTPALISSLRS